VGIAITSYGSQSKRGQMLKIHRVANGEVVFRLSGRMDAENVDELKELFGLEASEVKRRSIVLDLKDLTLVDRDAVKFLGSCEADSIKLKNCPAYIREWITRERGKA
jgi:anti-anti-sigma regulatory factor